MNLQRRKVGYVYSKEWVKIADKLPSNEGRSSLIHELAKAYGLFSHVQLIEPLLATEEDICSYHNSDFSKFLLEYKGSEGQDIALEEYGLEYVCYHQLAAFIKKDCPPFPELSLYTRLLAGSSLAAAEALVNESNDVVINWDGGRHHARRGKSAGFCYINDIVLAIMRLRKKFDKILYIDLDLHAGDGIVNLVKALVTIRGVESAFLHSEMVYTLSFHRFDIGFYPNTGSINSIGKGKGMYTTLNIPLRKGLSDQTFWRIFQDIVPYAKEAFNPDAIVVQLGCDGLIRDPHKEWNLTTKSFGEALSHILVWNLPTLLLGGGGYSSVDTARCYSYLTSISCDVLLFNDLPQHKFWTAYAPDYELHFEEGLMTDENTTDYLMSILPILRYRISQVANKKKAIAKGEMV